MWAVNPELSYRQVIEILKGTATDLNVPGWDAQTGVGLLNLGLAVVTAKTTVPLPLEDSPQLNPPNNPQPLNLPKTGDASQSERPTATTSSETSSYTETSSNSGGSEAGSSHLLQKRESNYQSNSIEAGSSSTYNSHSQDETEDNAQWSPSQSKREGRWDSAASWLNQSNQTTSSSSTSSKTSIQTVSHVDSTNISRGAEWSVDYNSQGRSAYLNEQQTRSSDATGGIHTSSSQDTETSENRIHEERNYTNYIPTSAYNGSQSQQGRSIATSSYRREDANSDNHRETTSSSQSHYQGGNDGVVSYGNSETTGSSQTRESASNRYDEGWRVTSSSSESNSHTQSQSTNRYRGDEWTRSSQSESGWESTTHEDSKSTDGGYWSFRDGEGHYSEVVETLADNTGVDESTTRREGENTSYREEHFPGGYRWFGEVGGFEEEYEREGTESSSRGRRWYYSYGGEYLEGSEEFSWYESWSWEKSVDGVTTSDSGSRSGTADDGGGSEDDEGEDEGDGGEVEVVYDYDTGEDNFGKIIFDIGGSASNIPPPPYRIDLSKINQNVKILAAIIYGEALPNPSVTPEMLAIASVVRNRVQHVSLNLTDARSFGAPNYLSVISHPGQFLSYNGGRYRSFLNGNFPSFVEYKAALSSLQAAQDIFYGKRPLMPYVFFQQSPTSPSYRALTPGLRIGRHYFWQFRSECIDPDDPSCTIR